MQELTHICTLVYFEAEMPTKTTLPPKKHLRVRLDPVAMEYALGRVRDGRFRSISAYLTNLVNRERTGQDSPMAHLEEKLSQTLAQLQDEVQNVQLSSEGTNAFLHTLAKHLLVTLPELGGDEKDALVRTAPKRYQHMLTNAGKELALRIDEGGVDAPR